MPRIGWIEGIVVLLVISLIWVLPVVQSEESEAPESVIGYTVILAWDLPTTMADGSPIPDGAILAINLYASSTPIPDRVETSAGELGPVQAARVATILWPGTEYTIESILEAGEMRVYYRATTVANPITNGGVVIRPARESRLSNETVVQRAWFVLPSAPVNVMIKNVHGDVNIIVSP